MEDINVAIIYRYITYIRIIVCNGHWHRWESSLSIKFYLLLEKGSTLNGENPVPCLSKYSLFLEKSIFSRMLVYRKGTWSYKSYLPGINIISFKAKNLLPSLFRVDSFFWRVLMFNKGDRMSQKLSPFMQRRQEKYQICVQKCKLIANGFYPNHERRLEQVWECLALLVVAIYLNTFSPVDQGRHFSKQCRSRWDGLLWAVSSGSTLFAIWFWFFTETPIWNNGSSQFQRQKESLQLLFRGERFKLE